MAGTGARDVLKRGVRTVGRATAAWRPLPDFLVIGTKRGGTTSFYFDVIEHPSVVRLFPPPAPVLKTHATKGVHYFDTHHPLGERWYRSYMPTTMTRRATTARHGATAVVGEASPYYLFHPDAARRAHALVPGARLVVLLRDPVQRTYSHWKERRRGGMEPLDFLEALDAELGRLAGERERLLADETATSYAWEQQSYVAQSRYADSLRPWLDAYGRDRLLVLASEDYYADPVAVLGEVDEFLGLPRRAVSSGVRRNAAPGEPLPAAAVERLRDTFTGPVADLVELTGRTFPWGLRDLPVATFPPGRRGVELPVGDRRAAALGICLYTASHPRPLLAQRAAYWVVRAAGTRPLPGPRHEWTPPWPPAAWDDLVAAWTRAVGPFDALAAYQRRQVERGGLTALLVRSGRPVAVVKVRDEPEGAAGLQREQVALAAVAAARPTTFSAPGACGAGTVGALTWSAQDAVFTRPHRPVLVAPSGLPDDVRRCLTGDAHNDLTPWNLRRDHRGRVWLYDWEDVGPAPAGADAAHLAATAWAVAGTELPTGLQRPGLEHWRARVGARDARTPADVDLRRRTLEALDRALDLLRHTSPST